MLAVCTESMMACYAFVARYAVRQQWSTRSGTTYVDYIQMRTEKCWGAQLIRANFEEIEIQFSAENMKFNLFLKN